MRRCFRSGVCVLLGLSAWAEAGALSLNDLARPDLPGRTVGLEAVRKSSRRAVLSQGSSAPETSILIKFRGDGRVRALQVNATDTPQAFRILNARKDVEFTEPNRTLFRQFEPSDPLIGSQWHHAAIGSADAWDWSFGSSGVRIAIVDAPFNVGHPDLSANAIQGWDVVNEVPVIAGDDEHASMCAGLAAGVMNNHLGVAGMGNFTVVPVNNAYEDLTTDIVQIDAAIRWAADNGIRVVSISWTGADSPVLNLAAQYLRDTIDGVVVMAGVNGAGYLGYTNQPCILAVSMTDIHDQLRSHYGPHIDFSAPGYAIYSTSADGYTTGDGTSYSTPLVAGVLAALFSINPTLSADDAIAILKATAVDLGEPGWDDHYGWGRVDYGRAAWLAAAMAGVADLGLQQLDRADPVITVSTEFHPGLAYVLMEASGLDSTNWTEVAAAAQTNGMMIEFAVEPAAGNAFFKVVGEPVLQ